MCEHGIGNEIRQHLFMMLDYHGQRGLILFRKYLKRYFDQEPGIDDLVKKMLITEDVDGFLNLLGTIDHFD